MDTQSTEEVKDSRYFKDCPAKRGFGPRRRVLIEELRSEENLLTHYIIATMPMTSRVSDWKPDPKAVAARTETEANIKRLRAELATIVQPRRPRF